MNDLPKQDGKLGFSHAALRVFQDFFVDIDLPVALTQNDEVAIPIAVYNYLAQAQNVRLQVKPEAWLPPATSACSLQRSTSRSTDARRNRSSSRRRMRTWCVW